MASRSGLVALAMLALVAGGCHGATESALRPPSARERAQIVASVEQTWAYESQPPESIRVYYHAHLRRPRKRPRVVAARISRADARYASVLVERRGARAVLVLERERRASTGGWGSPVAGPAVLLSPRVFGGDTERRS